MSQFSAKNKSSTIFGVLRKICNFNTLCRRREKTLSFVTENELNYKNFIKKYFMQEYLLEDAVQSINITQMKTIMPIVHFEHAYIGILD